MTMYVSFSPLTSQLLFLLSPQFPILNDEWECVSLSDVLVDGS